VDEAIILADRIIALNPDGTLGEEFKVSIPRPRDRMEMNNDDTFKALRAEVTNYLMDVGIEAKIEGSRILPEVTPIHGLPRAVTEAQKGLIEERFLTFEQLHKVYPTPKGPLTVVEDFNLKMDRGEFISLIGHSGCGKSTVLTMAAGLNAISKGVIKLDGFDVAGADPERAVVFQNHSLFPWLTTYQNVELGVKQVFKGKKSRAEMRDWIEHNLAMVHMDHALEKRPDEISGGMKQRVGIARALAMEPEVLLMDEPFGALDALTRAHLQDSLMEIHAELGNTVIMITHDVDEAVLLSDRIVMMTNGPAATIGEILDISIERPRDRIALSDDAEYNGYRHSVLEFLYEKQRKVEDLGSRRKAHAPTDPSAEVA